MFGTYRTLLALMVVGIHLGGVPRIGAYAVFGFYALSGYLMTLIMQSNYGYTLSGVYKYAVNRFLRIYPTYWFSLIFSAVLIFYVGEQFSSGYHIAIYFPDSISEVLRNIFLFFPFRESPRLTPPAWALTVELFFYILIGLGISKNKKLVSIWLLISVVYHLLALYFGLGWKHRYYTVFAASLPFSTGAFIYHYKERLLNFIIKITGKISEFLPFLVVFVIFLNWLAGYFLGSAKGLFFYTNYILSSFMVLILSERKELPFISSTFDKRMGDFSYPIYLIHLQVGLVVLLFLEAIGISYERPNIILMFVSIPVIFLFSYIITTTIGKPIELIRTKIKESKM